MLQRALSAIVAAVLGFFSSGRAVAGPGEPPRLRRGVRQSVRAWFFGRDPRTSTRAGLRVETVPFKVVAAGTPQAAERPGLRRRSLHRDHGRQAVQAGRRRPAHFRAPSGRRFSVRWSSASRSHVSTSARRRSHAGRWRFSRQDIAALKNDEMFGYGVDAGTGSFFDPIAGKGSRRAAQGQSRRVGGLADRRRSQRPEK